MNLSDVAALAEIGAVRIYQTKGTDPQRVVVTSAEVNGEGRLFITVRPENELGNTFRVRATSLSMPEVNDDGYFDMDVLCALLRERGVDAYTEHTGGGCATIYTGQPKGDYFVLAAGPGVINHRVYGFSAGSFAEFGYGPDDDDCEDFAYVSEMPLADLADQMVAKHNEVLATRMCPECETATCQRRPGYPYCTGDAAAYLARKS